MAIYNTPLLGLPYAGADTDETYAVLAGLFVKDGQKLTLPEIIEMYTPTIGSVYIKAADWTAADGTADAYDAKITIGDLESTSMILIYPATDSDTEKAKRLGIRVKTTSGSSIDDTFVIIRATGGAPTVTEDIQLVYIALRGYPTQNAGLPPSTLPRATVIGVDPYIATEEGNRDDIPASQRLVTEGLARCSADIAAKLTDYYTKEQTLSKAEINALVSTVPKFTIEVVTSLPTSNISNTTVYLVKSGDDDGNLYTEYIRAGGVWEKLGTQTVDLAGCADHVEIFLNDEDIAVVGHEYNIYHYAACHGDKPYTDYDIAVTLSYTNSSGGPSYQQAANYAECFRFTPTEARDYTLTYRVRDRMITKTIAEKAITLHVIEDTAVSGKNVLFIGDSFTAAAYWPAEIQHNLSGGGIRSVGTVSGTRTFGGVSLTVLHEGRSGWATWDYAGTSSSMRTKFESDKNVFRNPATDKFDLGYYMDTYHAGVTLNAVCIFLGTNGLGAITSTTNGMTELLTRIREYDATIPILLHYTLQNVGQDYWSTFYPQHNNTQLYRQNLWREQYNYYKRLYAGMSNVYIVPVYENLDYDLDFPHKEVEASARNSTTISRVTDGHPSNEGYLKMADVYYAYLLRYMRDGEQTYYSVTNNLTNVTNSNGATTVIEGAAYNATLTAKTGYTLSEVSVTMGGETVSVTGGVVSIASVTGNIIITASAVADNPPEDVDNLADPTKIAPAGTTPALTDDYWWDDYYISSKVIKSAPNLVLVNKVPMTVDQTITMEGFDTSENVVGGGPCRSRFRVLFCKEDGTPCATEVQPASNHAQGGTTGFRDFMDQDLIEQGIFKFSPGAEDGTRALFNEVAYVRICGYPVDGDNSNVIVTVSD